MPQISAYAPRGCPCGGQARGLPLQKMFDCGSAALRHSLFKTLQRDCIQRCWGVSYRPVENPERATAVPAVFGHGRDARGTEFLLGNNSLSGSCYGISTDLNQNRSNMRWEETWEVGLCCEQFSALII